MVANKQEWKSHGLKRVPGKAWPERYYEYSNALDFQQYNEGEAAEGKDKYLIPRFGFVAPQFERPKPPRGRVLRQYTTRPFFIGFQQEDTPGFTDIDGIGVSSTSPGTLVILCEGKQRAGFYICSVCGFGAEGRESSHKNHMGAACTGTLQRYALGHELETDVLCPRFAGLAGEADAYSLAYAVLPGAARALDVPATDLSVTIKTVGEGPVIVLYDNVPGGAGLVKELERPHVFRAMLAHAMIRADGGCGCDASCYGCLRSYQNQFAHDYLDRKRALAFLRPQDGKAAAGG